MNSTVDLPFVICIEATICDSASVPLLKHSWIKYVQGVDSLILCTSDFFVSCSYPLLSGYIGRVMRVVGYVY